MKKLSIEEKAKAYDEAIERAEEMCTTISDRAISEYIFPELKENEDEKTKRILHSISSKMSFHLRDIFTEEEFQCFDAWSNAWLEKQEQLDDKTKPKFKVGDKVIGIISGMQYYITKVCDNHYCTESGCIIMFAAQDNFELVEQQLKKIEQKPTDEEIKELLRTEYEKGRADAISEMQKSWSEEDEEHIKSLLERLEGMCKKDATFIRTKFAISEDEDWLKYLSPQSRWKPSNEQMNAFDAILVYNPPCSNECRNHLITLYNELKKLKGE